MKNRKYNVIKNKNSYVGRTYKVNDNDLPHTNEDSGKIVNFAVIEKNEKKIGGVRITTPKSSRNSVPLKSYHRIYKGYKTTFETNFQNGDFITTDDSRLHENPWVNNLSHENVNEIRDKVFNHSRQSSENKRKKNHLMLKNKKR